MAEEERRPSGCSLMVFYSGLFRRTPPRAPRRSNSVGSLTSISDAPSTTTAAASNRRRRSDETALVLPPSVHPQPEQKRPIVYHKRKVGVGPGPGSGLSGELDSMMYDPNRGKGNGGLVRASSSNVMLFGDLGNLRPGGNPNSSNSSSKTTSVLDFLPLTAKEIDTGKAAAAAAAVPAASLCRALSRRMEPEELKELGNEEQKKGRFVEALMYYDRAIAMDSKKAVYWCNKAAALINLGRFIEAVGACREAVKIDPSYKRAHHRLAGLHLRLGEAEIAAYHYKLAGNETSAKDLTQAQNVQIHMNICNEARRMKNWHAVLKEAEMAISHGADSAPQAACNFMCQKVFAAKAEALLKLQRHQDAEAVLIDAPTYVIDECTKFFGAKSNAYFLSVRAQIYMSVGRFEEAISTAQKAVRVDPSSKEAAGVMRRTRIVTSARAKGNELFRVSKFSEANLAYGEGLDHDPYNSVLLCNRAACNIKLGQMEKAVDDCSKALNVRPSYSKARLRRADCYTKLEKWETALQDYEVLIQDMPGDEEVQKGLAMVQQKLKRESNENVNGAQIKDDVPTIETDDEFTLTVDTIGLSVILFYERLSEDKQMTPYIEQLHRRYPSVRFAKVDTEETHDIDETDEVSIIPSFRIYKNGSRVKVIDGSDWNMLEQCIKSFNS